MSDRQCSSCGGFCSKRGCERESDTRPVPCPHIRSSGDGAHWCALAERPAPSAEPVAWGLRTTDGILHSLCFTEEKSLRDAHRLRQTALPLYLHPAPSAEPVAKVRCACGDIYPADSYGAGYIDAAGRCPNCDNAPLAPSPEPVGVTIQERIARLEQDPKKKAALDRARERLARAGVGAQSQPFWNDWPGVIKQTHELLPKGSREAMRQALEALEAAHPYLVNYCKSSFVMAHDDAIDALRAVLGEKE